MYGSQRIPFGSLFSPSTLWGPVTELGAVRLGSQRLFLTESLILLGLRPILLSRLEPGPPSTWAPAVVPAKAPCPRCSHFRLAEADLTKWSVGAGRGQGRLCMCVHTTPTFLASAVDSEPQGRLSHMQRHLSNASVPRVTEQLPFSKRLVLGATQRFLSTPIGHRRVSVK